MQQVTPEMETSVPAPEQAPVKPQPPLSSVEAPEERRPVTKGIEEKIKVSDSKPPNKQQSKRHAVKQRPREK